MGRHKRRRRVRGADLKLLSYESLVINEAQKHRGKWQELFANENPLHLEVGIGRGSFLIKLAERNPQINYIGIETKEEVMLYGVRDSHEKGLKNILFIWQNAQDLKDFFAPGEVDQLYLNFSDPWPKNRHAKRRLTHKNFLDMYQEILPDGGRLKLKTDHEAFFEFSLNSFADNGWQLRDIYLDLYRNLPEDNIASDYEEKFVKKGLQIYGLEAIAPALER